MVGVEMVDKHGEDQGDDDGGKKGGGADDVEGQCWVYGWFHRGDFGGARLGAHGGDGGCKREKGPVESICIE